MTARVYLGGRASEMAEGRIREQSHCRATWGCENKMLPPKESSSTLVASMAAVWNATPAEIKDETNQLRWKKQIKDFCTSRVRKHLHFKCSSDIKFNFLCYCPDKEPKSVIPYMQQDQEDLLFINLIVSMLCAC
jgi:HSP90 family molecular chaperone